MGWLNGSPGVQLTAPFGNPAELPMVNGPGGKMGIRPSSEPLSSSGVDDWSRLDGRAGNRAPRGLFGLRFAEFAAK